MLILRWSPHLPVSLMFMCEYRTTAMDMYRVSTFTWSPLRSNESADKSSEVTSTSSHNTDSFLPCMHGHISWTQYGWMWSSSIYSTYRGPQPDQHEQPNQSNVLQYHCDHISQGQTSPLTAFKHLYLWRKYTYTWYRPMNKKRTYPDVFASLTGCQQHVFALMTVSLAS